MNKDIIKQIFPKALERLDQGLCTWCEEPIWIVDFEDELSMKEYKINGLCQTCQNEFHDNIIKTSLSVFGK